MTELRSCPHYEKHDNPKGSRVCERCLWKKIEELEKEIIALRKDGPLICQDHENDALKKENERLRDRVKRALVLIPDMPNREWFEEALDAKGA